jgi:hypothetical protein
MGSMLHARIDASATRLTISELCYPFNRELEVFHQLRHRELTRDATSDESLQFFPYPALSGVAYGSPESRRSNNPSTTHVRPGHQLILSRLQ